MIIVELKGGLGNQMFQYAFGYAHAKRLGVELALEISDKTLQIHNGFELNRVFNIKDRIATQKDMRAVLGLVSNKLIVKTSKYLSLNKFFSSRLVEEQHYHFAPNMLTISDNSFVCGYWQSEQYFLEIKNEIRTIFKFKKSLTKQNIAISKIIDRSNSVSLHVRRNDYANNPKINATHGLCGLDYYQAAIEYIKERISLPYFIIFSDDIAWVKEHLKINDPHQYVDFNIGVESHNDMHLMSLCKHHIIANSSFSWWGAWLNPNTEKIVLAPKIWFANQTNTDDLIPQQWIRM